jgi:hypothetical protein
VAVVVKRRPVRGLLAGLLVGLGAAVMVVLYDVSVSSDLVLAAGALLGLLWGLIGPTRGRARAQAADRGDASPPGEAG